MGAEHTNTNTHTHTNTHFQNSHTNTHIYTLTQRGASESVCFNEANQTFIV
jgi:hypothetical protein